MFLCISNITRHLVPKKLLPTTIYTIFHLENEGQGGYASKERCKYANCNLLMVTYNLLHNEKKLKKSKSLIFRYEQFSEESHNKSSLKKSTCGITKKCESNSLYTMHKNPCQIKVG